MKRILFVCVENACRSQTAERFARAPGEGAVGEYNADSKPSGRVNPRAGEVMKEKSARSLLRERILAPIERRENSRMKSGRDGTRRPSRWFQVAVYHNSG